MPTQSDADIQRKARAFDTRVSADARTYSRRHMLACAGKAGAALDPYAAAAQRQAAELDALPKSIGEASGDAQAFARADMKRLAAAESGVKVTSQSRANMIALVKAAGLIPNV